MYSCRDVTLGHLDPILYLFILIYSSVIFCCHPEVEIKD